MTIKYSNVILTFFTILNQLKLYHWQTLSYPRHKASGDLYDNLDELFDKFIEVLHGRLLIVEKSNYRIMLEENKTTIILKNMNDSNGYELLLNIKKYLESSEFKNIINNSSELINIKDEMLGEVNKTIYLFSLN